ncbi:MAG: hypothetical protein ABSE16_04625 [Verrucomicrobiota bacterium]|jgi:hypothetical protein
MKNRLYKNCAYASTVLFCGFAGLLAYAWLATSNPRADESGIHWSSASLGSNLHVAVTSNWGGILVFFNRAMPYTGSVVSFTGDKSVTERGWTGWGLYFRLIEHTETNETWWTFMISLWYPVVICGILPAVFVVQRLRGTKPVTQSEGAKT